MTKTPYKIYLEAKDYSELQNKAKAQGFIGRGAISFYLQKIASSDLIFVDENIKKIMGLFSLSPKTTPK